MPHHSEVKEVVLSHKATDEQSAIEVFSAEEYASRQQRVREKTAAAGFDALFITDPANLYYLTGYNAWSFYMPQALVLPVDGKPLLLMREMDANGAHRTATGIDPDQIFGYPEVMVHNEQMHPGEWMAEQMREHLGPASKHIGYESEAHFFTIRTFLALTNNLPDWKFSSCNDLINWVRLIKSDAEIAYLRKAGRVVTHAMQAGMDAIREGRPMNEVAAAVSAAQIDGVPGADGDYTAIVPMLPTGAAADTPHLTWTAAPLPTGEPISLEIAGAHHRYHAPLARTAVIGRSSERVHHLASATVSALETALDTMRPGVTAHEVASAYQRVIQQAGYEKSSRLGYSIGIGYPPDWGERTVSIRPNDETVLETGMCFHIIAGQWEDGFGFENSEPVVVTESGIELLANFPRGLYEIEPGV